MLSRSWRARICTAALASLLLFATACGSDDGAGVRTIEEGGSSSASGSASGSGSASASGSASTMESESE